MPSSILNSDDGVISGTSGLKSSGGDDGVLNIQNNGTTAVTVNASGNVGIGTSSPTSKLDINGGSAATTLTVQTSGALYSANIDLKSSSTTTIKNDNGVVSISNGDAAGQLRYNMGGTERMRIDSGGSLLVGTTTVTGGGFPAGTKFISQASGALSAGFRRTEASGTNEYIRFTDGDDQDCGSIDVNATANTTAYTTSSDYRLKENIVPMTGALATVTQLNPVTWTWKHAPDVSGQGFIAHELQEVVPECVTGEKDAVDAEGNPVYQGIDTSFLVATLTAAIQELKAINDAQAERIETLEAKVSALEAIHGNE